jgi:hypothetical protein
MQAGNCHATDDQLDRYATGHLGEPELGELEEHLLLCPNCQDELAVTDAYWMGIRGAATELRRQTTAEARPWFRRLFAVPKLAWALGVAALALVVFAGTRWLPFHQASTPPALVLLESTRGAEPPLNSSTHAGKSFTLILDLTGLPPLPQYRLEIVDAAGRPVFHSGAGPVDNRLRATVAQGLPGGMYYVRLYTPGQELLREYGLQAVD